MKRIFLAILFSLYLALSPLLYSEGITEGYIAFLCGSDIDTFRIHILDLGTKAEKELTTGTHHGAPIWSPDGTKIAYSAKMEGGLFIVIWDSATDEYRILKHQYSWNDNPTWSADSKRISYISCEHGLTDQKVAVYELQSGKEEFWGGEKIPSVINPVWFPKLDILNAMSATVSQVTYTKGFDINKFFEEGYSTGVLIGVAVFPSPEKRLTTELVIFSKTQATPLPKELMLESTRFEEFNPQVSPKGSSLVFETNESGDREIYYLGRRGISNISNHHSADWNPVWSPNGEWIAFESFRHGRRGIYRVFPETARVFPLVISANYDAWSPAWSPDSHWICFVSNISGKPQLFLKNIEEDNLLPLTDKSICVAPCWRPKTK
ncbi:MAG: TolB family protein [Candidatus Hydrogenedens sp.]